MKHIWNTIGIMLIVALVTGMATDTSAGTKNKSKALMMAGSGKGAFSVTTHYLGTLEGDVLIGGERVYISSTTPVYVVGNGIQEDGYFSNGEAVYVTGVRRGGKAVAKMIVVRPDRSHQSRSNGASSQVGEYADDVPN